MENHKLKSHLNILGFYQIIGGVIGLFILFQSMHATGFSILIIIFLPILFALLFIYSIICGILCLKRHDLALSLSYINQILQIMGFAFAGFSFIYVSGIYFLVVFNFTEHLNVDYKSGLSTVKLFYNIAQKPIQLEINLIAPLLLIYISHLSKKNKNVDLEVYK